jgi:chitinase
VCLGGVDLEERGITMKVFKLILVLLIGFFLIGCNDDPIDNNDDDDIEDVVEPTLSIGSLEYTIEEGQTLQLEVEIIDSDEELDLIYFSNNNNIATVDLSGLVTAKAEGNTTITIILSMYPDQKLNVTINVTPKLPEDVELALHDFEAIKRELEETIPYVAESDIRLPSNRFGRTITWTSSNEDVITKFGFVTRGNQDYEVELTATMKYKTYEVQFKRTVKVNKMELKDLSNKKISFAYAMTTNIKEEHLRQLDVVNYSFAGISGNRFYITSQIDTLVRQAHNVGTRVVAAIGGGTEAGSSPFVAMTSTAENRAAFIESMMEAIDKYNLDGIDYDWEVPTAAERNNFSALIRETRAAFDVYDRELILTAAVSAGTWHIDQGYDVPELNKYLSYFNVMTYDLNNWPGTNGQALTRHHTHLYRSQIAPSLSADEAIRAYINAGASPEKIVLGVAAYGRWGDVIVNTEHGLNAMANNPARSIKFDEIFERYYKDPENSDYKLYYDDVAKASWLYNAKDKIFISFDDERSIEAKVEYVNKKNLGGIMYWDYTNDTGGRILGFIDKYLNK